ncbi:MAG: hypothetical protein ACE15F_00680, partial [bacterium]
IGCDASPPIGHHLFRGPQPQQPGLEGRSGPKFLCCSAYIFSAQYIVAGRTLALQHMEHIRIFSLFASSNRVMDIPPMVRHGWFFPPALGVVEMDPDHLTMI